MTQRNSEIESKIFNEDDHETSIPCTMRPVSKFLFPNRFQIFVSKLFPNAAGVFPNTFPNIASKFEFFFKVRSGFSSEIPNFDGF